MPAILTWTGSAMFDAVIRAGSFLRQFRAAIRANIVARLGFGAIVLLGVVEQGFSAEAVASRYQRTEVHMGMSFGIVLYAPDEPIANQAFTTAFARIEALNQIFSDYDIESEVSRLCDLAPTKEPVKVSSELAKVVEYSQDLSRRTGGAFDITAGPLTKLWRRARRMNEPPSPERLLEAREATGFESLLLDPANRTIQLKKPKMRLDFGAVVPGYAADEALRSIATLGIKSALVNASGDISVGDPPPGESAWNIDIAPLQPGGKPSRTVHVKNAAVSTSGDAFQYFELNGKRYSHIVDPKTGYGLSFRSSVTVIANTGLDADGLATAVSVLGPIEGLRLIESVPDAAALIVAAEPDHSVKTYASSRLDKFVRPISADIP